MDLNFLSNMLDVAMAEIFTDISSKINHMKKHQWKNFVSLMDYHMKLFAD